MYQEKSVSSNQEENTVFLLLLQRKQNHEELPTFQEFLASSKYASKLGGSEYRRQPVAFHSPLTQSNTAEASLSS
ncbi:hypothetical protein Gasu2_45070 [Galdieria sulphuraria]|nr:hypothetical protein Gasu2_45070 [Galdieria sulphuraria]